MLNSITAFLPIPCNICRTPKDPEFAKKDFLGGVLELGDSLPSPFLSSYNLKILFSTGFLIIVFAPLSILFGQKKNQPWNLLKSEGSWGGGGRKLNQIWENNFWKKLCPCLFTLKVFFLHPKKARQETYHLSGACDSGLSAYCLATHSHCVGISWHYRHCHVSLPNTCLDVVSLANSMLHQVPHLGNTKLPFCVIWPSELT